MKFVYATVSDKGGRENNQDCVCVAAADGGVCAAVCDGLGAYDGSDAAARICARTVTETFTKDPISGNDGQALRQLVRLAHDRITQYKEAEAGRERICTTVAVAVADETGVTIAHIGDSRIYSVRSGTVELLTRDHSLARIAVDRGEIALDDIRKHRDQNKLTRVLGGDYYIAPDCDVLAPLSEGDALFLCTDGVWEYVYDEDLQQLFAQNDAQGVIDGLVRLIDERKPTGNDNYTAAVIKAVRA